jgi:hypothetical protein
MTQSLKGEEVTDVAWEPDAPDPLVSTWMRYDLRRNPDGSLHADESTNDNDDDGYPDGEVASWLAHYSSWQSAQKSLGVSYVGPVGCQVTITIDGQLVTSREQYDPTWVPTSDHPLYRGVV